MLCIVVKAFAAPRKGGPRCEPCPCAAFSRWLGVSKDWKFPSPGSAAHSARGLHELQTRESCFLRTLYAGFGYAETDPCDIVAEQR
jgi:hypothetical protein